MQGTSARGRGFAAYLSACGGQLFIVRCAHCARGASLTTFGFVTTVPRYLPKASNSLTFVRGADRACCAPRKWLCRPTNACLCQSPHAPRRGIGVRTRQRHLAAVRGACRACCAPRKRDCGLICAPRKWLCRPTDALPVLVARTPPGGALAGALGSGTLPPPCRRTYARTSEIPVFPPKTNCILQSPVYINNSVVTGRSPANSVNRKSSKSL